MYNKVVSKIDGDPASNVGGTTTFIYTTDPAVLPANVIDPYDPIALRSIVTDPNGNQTIYDLNANGMVSRLEQIATRQKNSLEAPSYVTWTKYNAQNQPLVVVHPEGNSTDYEYETGEVSGFWTNYTRRRGLLLRVTRLVGNSIGLYPMPSANDDQSKSQSTFVYDPIAGEICATIDPRGNPINNLGAYFTPQNDGVASPERYTTRWFRDYQKNTQNTVKTDTSLQLRLFGVSGTTTEEDHIVDLILHVNTQMVSLGLTGFLMDLGDINGDGTGDGDLNPDDLPPADNFASVVKINHPFVKQLVPYGAVWRWTSFPSDPQPVELFTNNKRGQVTTHTDPEGNVSVTLRYPFSNSEGNGALLTSSTNLQQYGLVSESHVDAPHFQVRSMVGLTGDMVDFDLDTFPRSARSNTPDEFLDLVTRYEAGGPGGGCSSCAYDALGNPLAVTDPNGYTTRYERNEIGQVFRQISPLPYEFKVETHYDANGNVTRIDKEDKVVKFTSNDPKSPDFGKFVPTGTGGAANVPMTGGPGGTARPSWFTDLFEFDSLNRMTMKSIDATGSARAELVTRYAYDANSNLIQETKPEGNIVEYDYDERNLRIATRVGRDQATNFAGATTVNVYDKNGNLTDVIGPAQRGGAYTSLSVTIVDAFGSGQNITYTGDHVLQNVYNGFDRVSEAIDAVGGTTKYEYDPDGRVIKETKEGTVGGPTPDNRSGNDNEVLSIAIIRFEEAGRVYEQQQQVFIGDTTPVTRTITATGGGLEKKSTTNGHSGTTTLTDGGEGDGPHDLCYVLTRIVHDLSGRVIVVANDKTAQTNYAYDGANRQIESTDPLGNMVESVYDRNGNLIYTKSTEICTITTPAVADEVFEKLIMYDALNRMVALAEPGADGQISDDFSSTLARFTFTGFDSRGNRTVSVDPKGNTTQAIFDGASRQISTIQHMREDGQGSEGPVGGQSFLADGGASIVTSVILDGNGRVTRLIDDRANETAYQYDSMDRQVKMVIADSSFRQYTYDNASDVTLFRDENDSKFANTFDPLGRKILTLIDLGPGVKGTTGQSFEYDGLSRLTEATDTVLYDSVVSKFVYDSLSRSIEESQTVDGDTKTMTNSEWTSLTPDTFNFPGTQSLSNLYDPLYRRYSVETGVGGSVAEWKFFGPSRVAEVTLPFGLTCTMMNNARTHSAVQYPNTELSAWGDRESTRLGYDGAGRIICKRYVRSEPDGSHGYADPESVVGFTTAYDAASNKLFERALHAESRSHLYEPFTQDGIPLGGNDSANRLRQYQRGVLSSGTGYNPPPAGGSIVTPITLTGTNKNRTYDLDGLGNWMNTSFLPVPGSQTLEQRQHNSVNEIIRTKTGSSPNVDFDYDANGNTLNDGIRKYEYDAFNRVVDVYRNPNDVSPTHIATYTYDALNRRILKFVEHGGIPENADLNGTTRYAYFGWRCMQEKFNDEFSFENVWGIYLDELLCRLQQDDRFPVLSDMLYRAVATVAVGDDDPDPFQIVEAYDTDAYGNTLIFDEAGTDDNWFADNAAQTLVPAYNEFIFTGQKFDAETQIYYYKNRYYVPSLGRFVNRNPWGIIQGRYNLYDYAWMRPTIASEPLSGAVIVRGGQIAQRIGPLLKEGAIALRDFWGIIFIGLIQLIPAGAHVGRPGLEWADPTRDRAHVPEHEQAQAQAKADAQEHAAGGRQDKGPTSRDACDMHYGHLVKCNHLPYYYIFGDDESAKDAMSGNIATTWKNKNESTTSGPCIGQGTHSVVVRVSDHRIKIGSVVGCPCCVEIDNEASSTWRYAARPEGGEWIDGNADDDF